MGDITRREKEVASREGSVRVQRSSRNADETYRGLQYAVRFSAPRLFMSGRLMNASERLSLEHLARSSLARHGPLQPPPLDGY